MARYTCLALLLVAGAPALAQDYWEYKDWRVAVQTVDTGEDLRKTCTALTGGDGLPTLSVTYSDGDAGPPDAWPSVLIAEQAPRHARTLIRGGDILNFVFDDGDSAQTPAYLELAEGVFEHATGLINPGDTLLVLRGMRRAGQLDIVAPGGLVLEASLSGFTAAYLKIAEECGFSTEGVVD